MANVVVFRGGLAGDYRLFSLSDSYYETSDSFLFGEWYAGFEIQGSFSRNGDNVYGTVSSMGRVADGLYDYRISEISNGANDMHTLWELFKGDAANSQQVFSYVLSKDDVITGFSYFDDSSGSGNIYDGLDYLPGYAGNDTIDGLGGNDTMVGGSGNDVYYVRQSGDVVLESGGEGSDTIYSYLGNYLLPSNVENGRIMLGSSANLMGNSLDNVIYANIGVNIINGGTGFDTVSYQHATTTGTTGVTLNLALLNSQGYALASGISGADQIKNIENITGSRFADRLIANIGNNVLLGGLGDDTLSGGLGNDYYGVSSARDVVIEKANGGIDIIVAAVSYSLVDTDRSGGYGGNVENLTLGGTLSINGTGNGLANTLIGNRANNILNGGAGIDTMLGGAGNDTYFVDNANDRIFETTTTSSVTNAGGTDKAYSSVSLNLAGHTGVSFVESLTLTGTSAINGSGNGLANTLTGNAFANRLSGVSGNDVLNGGNGSDTLVGGTGRDTLYGGAIAGSTGDGHKDVFDFNYVTESTSATRDRIYNFVSGTDTIDLNGIDANANAANNQNFLGFAGNTATPHKIWYVLADADTDGVVDDLLVRGDVDGNAISDFEVAIIGVSSVSAGDFVL